MLRPIQNKTKSDAEGVFMKYFCFYILGFLILFSQPSHAQYAGGSFNMWGTGLNMGQQACQYSQGGRQRQSAYGLEDKKYQLEDEIESLETDLNDIETEYDSDKIPFVPGVATYLASVIRATKNTIDVNNCAQKVLNEKSNNQNEVSLYETCSTSSGKKPSVLCTLPAGSINYLYDYSLSEKFTYKSGTDEEKLQKATGYCVGWVESYTKKYSLLLKKQKELEDVEKKYEKAAEREEEAREKAEERAEARGYTLPETCATCGGGYAIPEPEISGRDRAIALGLDIFNTGAWLYSTNRISQRNTDMGWATPPLALGMPYPYATSNLYGAAYGGQGGLGCSPTIGGFPGAYGPGGIAGSPYGGFSPYGNQGGAYGYPPGGSYPGFTPGFAGGMYNPGVGQWGMPGPWGGAGVFPPAFGINASIGAGVGNPYGGYGGYGGNPYGAGSPYGGGAYGGAAFPGAYPGPYNYGYGLNANPYGGSITGAGGYGPGGYGGPPNFGPGGYNPYGAGGYNPYGAGGYNPYGGGGAGFGAGVGLGIGAGYNPYNPYGAGGYGNGAYNPYGAGGAYGAGAGYSPYQAQPLAFQNQSMIYSHLAAFDYETGRLISYRNEQRQQIMYYMMTGSYGGGTVYPPPGGGYGNGGLPPPPISPGNTGTGQPPR